MCRKLTMAGVPVAHPVCYMERGPGWRRRELLVLEDLSPAVSLRTRLADEDLSAEERGELIDELADLVRSLHQARFHHRRLRDTNVLVRGEHGGRALYVAGTAEVARVRLPRPFSDISYGLDLRKLALHLRVPVSEDEARRFFRVYCDGLLTSSYRRRLVKTLIRAFPGRHADASRLQPWLRRNCDNLPEGTMP
jgi:hypothetical protein